MAKNANKLAGTAVDAFKVVRAQLSGYLNAKGQELPDPTPMQPPVGFIKQESLHDKIRAMVVSEKLRMEAQAAGKETFEEADDFDVEDDYDPTSPYEEIFDPPATLAEREQGFANRIAAATRKAFQEDVPKPPPGEAPPSPGPQAPEGGASPPTSTSPSPTPGAPPSGPLASFFNR